MNDKVYVGGQWVSKALVVLIGLFGITTVGNVANFVEGYHKGWQGWTLGGALGFALFITAYISATSKDKETVFRAAMCAFAFGVSSAYFQFSIYSEHAEGIKETLDAFFLAFVPIMVGEAGLALVESSIKKEKDRRENKEAEVKKKFEDFSTKINEEVSKRENAESGLSQLGRELREMQDFSKSLQSEISEAKLALDAEISKRENAERLISQLENQTKISQPTPLKEKKSGKLPKEDRRSQLEISLRNKYSGVSFSSIDKNEIAKDFGVTSKTISTDIEAIREKNSWNGSVPEIA